ncbi:MAG: glycoside hydrolase family 18 [Bacteroidales bacterium]|nr:glycoside hydrolase family 18 [Bacteroidales bacterium]
MKNKLFLIASLVLPLALGLVACERLDPGDQPVPEPVPGPNPTPVAEVDPPIEEPAVTLNARIDDGRQVTAYVTYYGSQVPEATSLTHINYAFAELYMVDGVYQGFKPQGSLSRFESIVALKKMYPMLKICISFTHGVANSDNKQGGSFSALCKSESGRKAFAEDCKAFLEKYGIDGVDLDWEFPGLSWSNAACDVSCDVDNYVLLVKQLRETFGDKYTISYAGYCTDKAAVTGGYRYVDIKGMDKYVDYVNIMTYDLDEAPHHHSALSDTRAYKDCARSVQAYLNAGVAPNKLVLGIPFYGRHSWSQSPTTVTYKSILTMDPYKYRRNKWDATANCPYVETMGGEFFCGYDNPRSIAAKGVWARQKGLLGLMFWEYDQDDAKGTLRHAVWNAVMTQ